VEDILLSRGITSEAARIISSFANERLTEADRMDVEKIYSVLHDTLADIVTVNPPDFSENTTQKRMAFIGPTGVGKTTTLAKIAAKYLATQSNSIALITIDTYRIAAVEQLKVYGEIMHLPVEIVITPQQLQAALDKHRNKELILIDTAGRSPLDSLSIKDLHMFFPPGLGIDNYLVLSAVTRDNELMEAYSHFQQIPLHSTIFTKIDECSTLGVMLNIQVQKGSPVSYVTNGQRVPEDILEADKKQLAQLIIPSPNGIAHD
jgi:flagellar biosynthesis protein FlhF